MDKDVYLTVISFIYDFLGYRLDFFDYSLSLGEVLIGAFLLGLAIYIFFRITD